MQQAEQLANVERPTSAAGSCGWRKDIVHALYDILLTAVAVVICVLPAILADRSKRRSVLMLALSNNLFGRGIVGWFAALDWAFHPDSARKLKRI
ncbi:superinfection immunity protein [Caballeronia sp. INML2]|jgi:hypothetical protein|uniref:superinfection immunity protein n=1 Tax=Caballeronia sp. INML2 TaxID=2921748 RepID=UPI0020291D4B|nr:superinfection immunity protein [Caballeronia sp. INML2]